MTDIAVDQDPQSRLQSLIALYSESQFVAAADVAQLMDSDRQWHPIQAMVLAHLGVILNDDVLFRRGLALIRTIRAAAPEMTKALLDFDGTFIAAQAVRDFRKDDRATVLKLLEISRGVCSELAKAFPKPVADARPPRPRLPQYAPNVRLLEFKESRRDPPGRKALAILRKFFSGPDSREHDIGPRMCRGLELGGWTCRRVDPSYEGRTLVPITTDRLITLTAETEPEVILVDNDGIAIPPVVFADFAIWLRRYRPGVKLVHVNFDPWIKEQWLLLRQIGNIVDMTWSPFPGHDLWNMPEFKGKTCFVPFPVGVDLDELPPPKREPATVFQGAVEWYNSSRAYWLAALTETDAPVQRRVTTHDEDGLDPIESYRRYLARFQTVDRLLSFSLRPKGARIATGRSFEVIYSGACLIQEQADDMDHYFLPLVHYLPFTSFDELRDLLAMLDDQPELVASIAKRGQDFYLENYADRRIARCLDYALFGE